MFAALSEYLFTCHFSRLVCVCLQYGDIPVLDGHVDPFSPALGPSLKSVSPDAALTLLTGGLERSDSMASAGAPTVFQSPAAAFASGGSEAELFFLRQEHARRLELEQELAGVRARLKDEQGKHGMAAATLRRLREDLSREKETTAKCVSCRLCILSP